MFANFSAPSPPKMKDLQTNTPNVAKTKASKEGSVKHFVLFAYSPISHT
jgi:hypothetical protein